MGGTVFSPHARAVRIDRPEHDAIAARMATRLAAIGIDARSLPSVRSKTDFGDVDLVAPRSQTHRNLPEGGAHVLALAERDRAVALAAGARMHHRGPIRNPALHMLVDGRDGPVQVDLMSIEDRNMEFATRHLSWGDAGALAAVYAANMGMKMGMNGISLLERTGATTYRARLRLDYDQALDLLGLDPVTHRDGFDTPDDIYAWIASGKYFDPRLWTPGWMTSRARHRAGKRDSHQGLHDWITANRPQTMYDWGARRGERTHEWTGMLLTMFPEARDEIERQRTESAVPTGLRAFFNGDVVSAVTGMDQRDDGFQHMMNAVRKAIGHDRLLEMAAAQDKDALMSAIRKVAPQDD